MSAQTSYRFGTPIGSAGGIGQIAPYSIDTFLNEENTGVMHFGLGVVKSATKPGISVRKPVASSTAAAFEGITVNNRTTEYDLDGHLHILKGAALGVMRYGHVYAQVADNVTTAYGDALYLIVSGDDAGKFTNAADGNVAVKGRFLGGVDASNQIALVELFNQAQA